MRRHSLITLALLMLVPALAPAIHAEPSNTPTTRERFDRALPRVESWVRAVLEREDPIQATVAVLDTETFKQRAATSLHAAPGAADIPAITIAVTTPNAEILIHRAAFDDLAERAKEHDMFADDVVTLVLAHELTHAAHLDTLAQIQPGEKADAPMLERLLMTSLLREGHALFVQHRIANQIGGEPFERFSRDLVASTPLATARAKVVQAAEQALARAQEQGGAERVLHHLQNPPATAADILRLASPEIDLADALVRRLRDAAPKGDWTDFTRDGTAATLGQGWNWLPAEERAGIEASIQDAFTVSLIDRASANPRMISLGVLTFADDEQARNAPEQLKSVLELVATRFDDTPEGQKRDTTLVPHDTLPAWRVLQGAHPLPGSRSAFGAMGVRVHANRLLILNTLATPPGPDDLPALLRAIDAAFEPATP